MCLQVNTVQTAKPFNPEVQKKAIGDEEPITCRPADLIPDELDTLRKEMCTVDPAG